MSKYRQVYRCKKCLKISEELPIVCPKCRETIGKIDVNIPYIPGATIKFNIRAVTRIIPTENCETVLARKKLWR